MMKKIVSVLLAFAVLATVFSVASFSVSATSVSLFWPADSRTINSYYGSRTYVNNGQTVSDFHSGIDIAGSVGNPIYAAADGTVVKAGYGVESSSYGNQVILYHPSLGIYTNYAHASQIKVSVGQTVSAGQTIALIGATGNVTGPHLHFETRTSSSYSSMYNPLDNSFYYTIAPAYLPGKPTLTVSATDSDSDVVLCSSEPIRATSFDYKIFDMSGNVVLTLYGQPSKRTVRLDAGTYKAVVLACNDELLHGDSDYWWTSSDAVTFTVAPAYLPGKPTLTVSATDSDSDVVLCSSEPIRATSFDYKIFDMSGNVVLTLYGQPSKRSVRLDAGTYKAVVLACNDELLHGDSDYWWTSSDAVTFTVKEFVSAGTSTSITDSSTTGTSVVLPTIGDVNGDGDVNMKDVLALRKFLAAMDVEMNMENADTNGDTFVNMKDVLMLRKFLAGIIEKLGA